MTEAGEDLLAGVLREAVAFEGLVDDFGKVPAVDVLDVGPLYQAPGEEAVLVAVGRTLNAVGVEDDRAGEVDELLGLILPGTAEVARQVGILLEPGIAVGRKHLAMGVDVDPFAFGLLEQFLEHLQVVTGDQDRLAGLGAELNRSRYRVAVAVGVGLVEQFHGDQVDAAALHGEGDEIHQAEVPVEGGGQGLVGECVDFVALAAENQGMVGVGGVALHAVDEDLLDRLDVRVDVVALHAVGFALLHQADGIGRGLPLGGFGDRCADRSGQGLGLLLDDRSFAEDLGNRLGVEVDVGYRGEKPFDHEAVDLHVLFPGLAGFVGIEGNAFEGIDQQVLQGGDIRLLTADADLGAAAVGCLLALKAKHVFLLGGVGG